MKRVLFLVALWGGGAFAARSQTVAAMAEQLVELKLLEQSTASGYQTMTTGVDTISQIETYLFTLLSSCYDQNIFIDWPADYVGSAWPRSIYY